MDIGDWILYIACWLLYTGHWTLYIGHWILDNVFEDQFISKYLPRILHWALNYDCGGAEYPDLFANWDELLENQDIATFCHFGILVQVPRLDFGDW